MAFSRKVVSGDINGPPIQEGTDLRCQPSGVGSMPGGALYSGYLVQTRKVTQHQLAGIQSHPISPRTLSTDSTGGQCLNQNRQYDNQSLYQPSRGYQVKSSDDGGLQSVQMGRKAPPVHQGRTKHSCQLVEPPAAQRDGVETQSPSVSSIDQMQALTKKVYSQKVTNTSLAAHKDSAKSLRGHMEKVFFIVCYS